MAAGSTTYTFEVSLSDIAKECYQQLTLRIARHASELLDCTVCKALAFCLEYSPSLELSKGLDDPEMPALWARDLTGKITQWIEIGSPSAEKLHKASKNVADVCIYTYKNPLGLFQQLEGSKIHRAETIPVFSFANTFLPEIAALTEKRNVWSLTVSEGTLYLEVKNASVVSVINKQFLETF